MQPLDFAVINRLHLPPEPPDFLFLVVIGKDFAETLERDHFRRQFIPAQKRLKCGRRSGDQSKPQVPGKRGPGIAQLMLSVKLPCRVHRRALLLPQALAHLRPERRPIVGAHVRFEARGQQHAHGREHRFAAVYVLTRRYNILPIYKPPTRSVKESTLISAKPQWPSDRSLPRDLS